MTEAKPELISPKRPPQIGGRSEFAAFKLTRLAAARLELAATLSGRSKSDLLREATDQVVARIVHAQAAAMPIVSDVAIDVQPAAAIIVGNKE